MSNLRYAVVEFAVGIDGYLVTDIWFDGIDSIEDAEQRRSKVLIHSPSVNPQNVQVIQYAT